MLMVNPTQSRTSPTTIIADAIARIVLRIFTNTIPVSKTSIFYRTPGNSRM
jgi:hypothetical protein